jgi:hypothetical protein
MGRTWCAYRSSDWVYAVAANAVPDFWSIISTMGAALWAVEEGAKKGQGVRSGQRRR